MWGKDTRRFCNGMFSNNIRDLQPGGFNRNVMLNDKGHIQGQLEVWCLGPEELLVTLEGVAAESFIERYDRFIIMDEVEQQDLTGVLHILSLQGPMSRALLEELELPVPEPGHFVEQAGLRVAHRPRCKAGGYDLLSTDPFSLKTSLLAGGAVAGNEAAAEVLRIEAGLARWPVDMSEKSLLHEMNMVLEYCNFNKGCYIGQEVINRIDVMGQVNKKLFGLELAAAVAPKAEVFIGETLVGVLGGSAEEAGLIRALAVLRKSAWEVGTKVEVGGDRVAGTVFELPF
jgi:aminomethyltransferase